MSEWKEYKLDEIYSFGSGLSKSSDHFGFGYDFLAFKDVFNNYFIPQKLSQLVDSTEKERISCSIQKGDVFLTRTSETQEELGMSCVALKDYPKATFNGFTKRLRPKGNIEIVPEYAGYYFRSPKFRSAVTSMSSITTRASLNNDMLAHLCISLPSIETQQQIGGLLKSLDDKIDLLHRQNATLEKMAETLFRQWFVERKGLNCDFDDLYDEDDLSEGNQGNQVNQINQGSDIVEEAKEEWEERPLSSIAIFLNGLACQKFPPKNDRDKLPVLKIKELSSGISENSDWATAEVKPEYIVKNGDVIFAWSASLMVKIQGNRIKIYFKKSIIFAT